MPTGKRLADCAHPHRRSREVSCAHPGTGLPGRRPTAIAPDGSGFSPSDGESADAEANDTTTNDRLAMQDTKANAAHASLALQESGSNFTDRMTLPSLRTGQR